MVNRSDRNSWSGRTFSSSPAPSGLALRPFGPQPVQQSYQGPAAGYVVPAGDVPAATYQAGTQVFNSTLRAVGAEPTFSVVDFQPTLQRTVNEIMGGGITIMQAMLVKGARGTVTVRRAQLPGVAAFVPGVNLANVELPAWWVNINAIVVQASRPYELNGPLGLNRAIARAIAQVVRWSNVDSRLTAPTDGGSLDAQFRSSSACSGGANYLQVWAQACTRPQGATAPPPDADTSTRPVAISPTPTAQSAPALAAALAQNCATRLQAATRLRATQTFAIGTSPSFPAGTAVTVRGPAVARQGSLTLYPVSIAGVEGFMPLSSAEMAACPMFAASPASAPRPQAVMTRGAPTAPPAPGTSLASLSGDSSSMTYVWITLAVLGAFGVTAAVVKRKEIKAAFSKRNGRKRARRTR